MVSRRGFAATAVAAAWAGWLWRLRSATAAEGAQAEVDAFVAGAPVVDGGVTLEAPDFAEDGFSVPLRVVADGALSVAVFAPANPFPRLLTARLDPDGGATGLTTRVRLAETQTLIALARHADGTVRRTRREVAVAMGGCHV